MEKAVLNEMIKKLVANKNRLLAEIEHLDKAINSLNILKSGFINARLTNDIVTNVTNEKQVRKNYYEDVLVIIPEALSFSMTTIDLFFYSLNALAKESTVDEIAAFAYSVDKSKSEKFLLSRFRDIASGLYRAGKIYADTTKKKFKYSLKEVKVKELGFEEKLNKEIDDLLDI